MSKSLLFISHQASRTGAPIVLLHLLRWLKQHSAYQLIVLLQEGGEMESEFRELGETLLWEPPTGASPWQQRLRRISQHTARHQRRVQERLRQLAPALIYANTVVSADLALVLKPVLNCPVVCHVHELATVIDAFIGAERFTRLCTRIDCFVAASEAVADNLRRSYQVPAIRIQTIHEFVPVLAATDFTRARQQVRQELGIPAEAFVVAGAGTIDWRKAPDLFIQVAQHVAAAAGKRVYFIWPGGKLQSEDGRRVRHDVERAKLTDSVQFLGSKTNPYDYLSAADVFLLTSREDPYPLVCLEAAALGKPILCFDRAGGMPEFVEQDCGVVLPYLRSDLMAAAVLQLRDDVPQRQRLGENAARKLRARHSVEQAGSQVSELLAKVLAGSSAASQTEAIN